MDANDQDDIIKKVKTAGNNDDNQEDNGSDDGADDNAGGSDGDTVDSDFSGADNGDMGGDSMDSGEVNEEKETPLFLDKPKKNNMFQPGSNDVLKEQGESQNYMFWQNLKTIHHAAGELLGMDQAKVDAMIANGHAWAVDHIATSSDDIEEVYHFLEANLKDGLNMSEKSSIFAKIKNKLQETFNQEDQMNEPMIEPMVKPAPVTKPSPDKVKPNVAPSRKNKPFLPMPEVQPDPKASN